MSKPRCVSNKGQLLAAAQIYLLSLKSFVAVHWRYACIILCLLCQQYSVIDTGMAPPARGCTSQRMYPGISMSGTVASSALLL